MSSPKRHPQEPSAGIVERYAYFPTTRSSKELLIPWTKDVSCLTSIWFVGTIMSVADVREHSLHLSYDANAPSPSGESRMVAGVPAAPFRGGVNTPSTHRNPAWINLAGSIAGLDLGHGRVDFVWPSDQDRRQAPAAPRSNSTDRGRSRKRPRSSPTQRQLRPRFHSIRREFPVRDLASRIPRHPAR